MTINGINSSSQLSTLLKQLQQAAQTTASQSSSSSSASTANSAYSLSLGQSQADTSLLGYSSLGKLINQTDQALAGMDQANPSVTATLGDGSGLQQTYAVNVSQLAQPQISTSQSYPSASQTIFGAGTLTIQAGAYSANGGSFTASRSPVSIPVTDGSLNGIASAINKANDGITATVVKASDGGSQLQLTGQSGADAGFQIGGIAALGSSLQLTQASTDAEYSVNGGATQTSPTNSGVSIGQGATADLTTTGPMTVSVPFGLSMANGAAQTLVSSVNSLVNSLSQLTGKSGQLSGDTGVAGSLSKALSQALTTSGGNALAAIGITTQSDGTLAIDQSTLQQAYTSNPTGTRATLDKVSTAIQTLLSGNGGAATQIKSEMQTLANSLTQTSSLLSYLNGSGTSQSSSSSLSGLLGGSSDTTSSLLAALGVNSGSNTSGSSTSALLAALGVNSGSNASGSSTSALLAALEGNSASSGSSTSALLAALEGNSGSNASSSSTAALLAALSKASTGTGAA